MKHFKSKFLIVSSKFMPVTNTLVYLVGVHGDKKFYDIDERRDKRCQSSMRVPVLFCASHLAYCADFAPRNLS